MKNDNKIVKFTIFVLLLTIVAFYIVSGTYAKYTSEFAGSDTAIVAKWDVSAGDASTTIDLFNASKIYDTNGVNDFSTEGTDDADVVNAATDAAGIIAPGTWGKFSYVVSNNSQVNATYAVDYEVSENGIPLEWSVDGATWTTDLSNVSATTLEMNKTATVTVYWRWDFEDGTEDTDTADTTLGTATTLAEPEVTITTTFTQVD